MKVDITYTMRQFVSGQVSIDKYLHTIEEWNKSGYLWEDLTNKEHKKLSNYMRFYFDMYTTEDTPQSGFIGKVARKMDGHPDVDLAMLKKATLDLLDEISRL